MDFHTARGVGVFGIRLAERRPVCTQLVDEPLTFFGRLQRVQREDVLQDVKSSVPRKFHVVKVSVVGIDVAAPLQRRVAFEAHFDNLGEIFFEYFDAARKKFGKHFAEPRIDCAVTACEENRRRHENNAQVVFVN